MGVRMGVTAVAVIVAVGGGLVGVGEETAVGNSLPSVQAANTQNNSPNKIYFLIQNPCILLTLPPYWE